MILVSLALSPQRPLLLAHVMPWFEKDGWHWRMNAKLPAGKVASHFTPMIGAYDSMDRKVVELQVQWMKLAGFDGVIADWYGTQNWFDYPVIHARTELLFDVCEHAGMKICVMYEDQTVKNAITGKLTTAENALSHARQVGVFLASDWLKRKSWLTLQGKKVFFVFGPQYFEQFGWDALLKAAGGPSLITEMNPLFGAGGAFDWPVPTQGVKMNLEFPARSKSWGIRVATAYPRFKDWYKLGGAGEGYGELPDNQGSTYRQLLTEMLKDSPDAVQVTTWNDWGEGTQIEPSKEFGLRDLAATQEARKAVDPTFAFHRADLGLPLRLYERRLKAESATLRSISEKLLRGETVGARQMFDKL